MSSASQSPRRRGIQTSVSRLRSALVESGLKTQTALAERIADLESIDTPPRSLVQKAFKGGPVDASSLERLARALGVEAWTLYRTTEEESKAGRADRMPRVDLPQQHEEFSTLGSYRSWLYPTMAVVFAGIMLVIGVDLRQTDSFVNEAPSPVPRSLQPTVVILPFDSPHAHATAKALGQVINETWRLLPRVADGRSPEWLLGNGVTERVIASRYETHGRWAKLSLYLHESGVARLVWSKVLPAAASQQRYENLMSAAASALIKGEAHTLAWIEADNRYLEGRGHLDRMRSEINVRRALTAFEGAIRLRLEHADAHAGLCEALISDHVRTGDVTRLDEAEAQCVFALELDSGNLEGQRAGAYLERRRGNLDASHAGFTSVLKNDPGNVDALLGLAGVYTARYRKGDNTSLQHARATLEIGRQLEPDFWKVMHSLARVHYYGGELDAAIRAARRAAELDPSPMVLSNLGSFLFCKGNFSDSRQAYQEALEVDRSSFVGPAQLAIVQYFERDFEAAAAGFRAALELQQDSGKAADHQLWGNYAGALHHLGQRDEAVSVYAGGASGIGGRR